MFYIEGERYKQQLIELANNCNLPVNLAYFITKDFCNELYNVYKEALYEKCNNITTVENTVNLDVKDIKE